MSETTTIPSSGAAFTFTFPEKDRQPGDPTKITLRSRFSIGTEKDATKAAGAYGNLNYELLHRITLKVDGKPVDQGLDFMENWSPKVRVYAVRALNMLMVPEEVDAKGFLDTMVTEA
jgi:hypothetical protein